MSNISQINQSLPNVHDKIQLWHEYNANFKKAIDNNDASALHQLLEDGYPFIPSNYFKNHELVEFEPSEYENISDNYYEVMLQLFDDLFANETKTPLWELLTEYLIYEPNELGVSVRLLYFSYTKNFSKALQYAEQLTNTCTFLEKQCHIWLCSALYNENNEFYDEFAKIVNKSARGRTNSSLFALTGKVLQCGKYYNLESWKKYYYDRYSCFATNMAEKKINPDSDLYSAILFELLEYPIKEIKKGQNKDKVQPIIDFLIEDYASFSEINKFELIMAGLFYEHEKDLQWKIRNKQATKERFLAGMRKAFLENSIEQAKLNGMEYIAKAISLYDADECIDALYALKIPSDRYSILERYIELSDGVNNSIHRNTEKKTFKI